MASLMQLLARYPRHIRYPSDIVAHLDGSMRAIFMGYAEDPYKLRAKDAKEWFVEEYTSTQTTVTGESLTLSSGRVVMPDGQGVAMLRVVHAGKTYLFGANHLASLVPLELLFANLTTLGASVWVDNEAGLQWMSSFGNYYALEEAGAKSENDSYAEVVDFSSLGITTLAELIANSYRFHYDQTRGVWAPITNQQIVLLRMRTPYYLLQRDNIVPAAEEALLASASNYALLDESYVATRATLARLEAALVTPFDIGPKGQGVMQDPLFGFSTK